MEIQAESHFLIALCFFEINFKAPSLLHPIRDFACHQAETNSIVPIKRTILGIKRTVALVFWKI